MGWTRYEDLEAMLAKYRELAISQFEIATSEPKVDEANVMARVFAAPLDRAQTELPSAEPSSSVAAVASPAPSQAVAPAASGVGGDRRLVMRKAMTQVLDELMAAHPSVRNGV